MSVWGWAVAIFLLFYGLWSFPLSLFGPERARIPGDMGDSRFNNYILEHFHQWATGRVAAYWDAPFMYPYKNTIALSDNLLGTAPLYSAFRIAGFNRESAYQLWILSLFALNYACCFLVLRAWGGRTVLAACGAYVFAFGIYNIGQMEHAQVFPKFMVPVALWLFWRALITAHWRVFLLAVLATIYQFYCGIYMGFLLLYVLACLLIAHILVHRKRSFEHWPRYRKSYLPFFGSVLLGGALLFPLMRPYIQVAGTLGTRTFPEVINTIPRPVSYFFTHPAAASWRDLSRHSQFAFEEWWSHFHFMGALPWLAILAFPVVLLSKGIGQQQKRDVIVAGLTLLLSIALCLNIGGITLYKILFNLPGLSALRAIDRVINVQAALFVLVFALVALHLFQKPLMAWGLSLLLPMAVVLDNQVDTRWLKSYDKHDSQSAVNEITRCMVQQYDKQHAVIAYMPVSGVKVGDDLHARTIATHLSAMLAAQGLGLPTVNSYTGSYPGNYLGFFDHMDQRTLDAWCSFNHIPSGDIQPILNLEGLVALHTDTVVIRAASMGWVSADDSEGGHVTAMGKQPSLWETYTRLSLADGRIALIAHNDRFLAAQLTQQGQLSASARRPGDFALFTMHPVRDNLVALQAFNGRYLTLDSASSQLMANADSIGLRELFRFERAPTR